MGLRSTAAMVAATAILLVSVPAAAQDNSSTVSFDGVGFTLEPALGASVDITRVPGTDPEDQGPAALGPGRLAFTPYGAQAEDKKVPRARYGPDVVCFYRTADIADYDWQSQQLEQLQSLLADRPDLEATTPGGTDAMPLPFVLDAGASQAIDARAQYVDTPELSGISYLTVFRQDLFPFAASDFWYTFQGLSNDGEWYVAADFRVDASMFPDEVTQKQAKRLTKPGRWNEYQQQSLEVLEAAEPDAFSPPLTTIDALVRSITFAPASTD